MQHLCYSFGGCERRKSLNAIAPACLRIVDRHIGLWLLLWITSSKVPPILAAIVTYVARRLPTACSLSFPSTVYRDKRLNAYQKFLVNNRFVVAFTDDLVL